MQDKVDGGCLSPADEEREPCLKETVAAAESVADKNNGTISGAAAATAEVADDKKPLDNNNGNGAVGGGGHKFYAFAAATSLEQKFRDKTGFSRTGVVVAGVALLLFLILCFTQVTTLIMWPRPPRVFPVCRSVSCLRASAEVRQKKPEFFFFPLKGLYLEVYEKTNPFSPTTLCMHVCVRVSPRSVDCRMESSTEILGWGVNNNFSFKKLLPLR